MLEEEGPLRLMHGSVFAEVDWNTGATCPTNYDNLISPSIYLKSLALIYFFLLTRDFWSVKNNLKLFLSSICQLKVKDKF